MKNRRYIRIPHLVTLTALAALLAACGNSAPGESDAKQAVQAQLGDCKYVEMSDFNRVNGTQGSDDHHYQVEVQYNLTLEADGDQKDKLEDWAKKTSERQDLLKQEIQIRKDDADSGKSAADDSDLKDDEQKQAAIYQELITSYGPRTFRSEFDQACPNFPGDAARDLFTKVDAPGFSGKNTLQFHYTLDMVRTDNGWQLDR
ncbi:hypothetical protein [Burkholderia vietnamiensis]|uniref:hypothetical protein n=1 Tax=Burkholderia vietnamiensis TaxID=60552 RepID=UPI000758DB03|nr:hypothetical protein [Burkholderia vietnamiensis]KVF29884.1 hypothetical protein WJ08_18300 [Burkholderia vietnamiensis]KVF42809.1 hypothetical protein WJ10_11810 [Burkholderia vietnamiensis]HDR9240044.1 hypothetical protein [Burkholderia vietnamiensis]